MTNIHEILRHSFGYDSFRPMQEEIISHVMKHEDCLVLMPTGGGKSICYQVPAIAMQGTAIVVSPLISLMKDQVEALQANGIEAEALNSGNDFSRDTIIRRKLVSGQLKLLYVSPERLLSEIDYLLKQIPQISLFAIDEAHCISQWGHDFRPEYTQLSQLREAFPSVPMMALTATADKVTRTDIIKQLRLKGEVFISSFDRPNLSLSVKRGYSTAEKQRFILNFIKARPTEPGIVYCLSRKNTEAVSAMLQKHGVSTAPIMPDCHSTTAIQPRSSSSRTMCRSSAPPLPSAWASTRVTCDGLYTTTCRRASRTSIRRLDVQDATAPLPTPCCSTRYRTWCS